MHSFKRTTGMGLLALWACAFLLLVSITASSSYAQSSGTPSKATQTFEGEDGGADQGDPDAPTGDAPVPSGAGGSYDGGGMSRGHAMNGGIVEAAPTTRGGLWAHWRVALKLLARNFAYIR
jgi:hypothetical protein